MADSKTTLSGYGSMLGAVTRAGLGLPATETVGESNPRL